MAKPAPILCIVGASESGKTTLMEGLIRELSKRGCRVATIKHTHHTVELDQPGKDSWRHRRAGAALSIVCTQGLVAVFSEIKEALTVEEVRSRFIRRADLILIEGFKDSGHPKVVVVGHGTWNAAEWTDVRAIVSDRPLDADIPVFRRNDTAGIIAFLEREFLPRRKNQSRNSSTTNLEERSILSN